MVTVEERARKGERVYIFSEMTFVTSFYKFTHVSSEVLSNSPERLCAV